MNQTFNLKKVVNFFMGHLVGANQPSQIPDRQMRAEIRVIQTLEGRKRMNI